MDILLNWLQSGLSAIGPFLILLGLLIFVHELGHFLVAKWCGVRVEVFSLGFGKKILKHKKGDTTYCISAVPLGGYVKMYGDDPTAEVPPEEQNRAFLYKPVSQRIAIVLAGPLMNFLFAIPLFVAVGINGEKVPGPDIGDLDTDSAAYAAGFRSGDKILSVEGQDVTYWQQVDEKIKLSPEREIEFRILRAGTDGEVFVKATPVWVPNDNILSLDNQVAQIPGLTTAGRASIVGLRDKDSPAALAGLKTLDIISSVNGQTVNGFRELESIFAGLSSEDQLTFKVRSYVPEKKTEERTVVLNNFQQALASRGPEQSLTDLLGFERPDLYLLKVKEDTPAFKAGLKDGDKILALDGEPVQQWKDVLQTVKAYKADDKSIHFTVIRQGTSVELDITPEMTGVMNRRQQEEQRGHAGNHSPATGSCRERPRETPRR